MPTPPRIAKPPRESLSASALCALVLLLAANTIAYVGKVCNPLLVYDNWVFVDTFLRVALEEGAGLGDYLVKRAGVDHAQPLGKLVMLLNYRWFGLDFRLEGYLGIVFAIGVYALLCALVLRACPRPRPVGAYAVLAAIATVLFSIDTLHVYLYSMVTMWHSLTLCFLAVAWLSWRALHAGSWWILVVTASIWGIVADDTAILGVGALSIAIVGWGWREGRLRDAARLVALLAAVLLACRGVYAAFGEIRGSTQPEFNVGLGARISALAGMWRDAWTWIATPLSSGVLHRATGDALLGPVSAPARNALAVALLGAHLFFWRSALRDPVNLVRFVAVALMLYFYAHVAGLLYARVFARGPEFLEQQRYVVFYRLGMVALLLMLAARLSAKVGAPRAWAPQLAGVIASMLLALQLPVALHEWRNAKALPRHYAVMAAEMGAVARNPALERSCTHGVDICRLGAPDRSAMARFLVAYRVNLFSPAFQRRHPDLARAAGLQPSPDASL